MDFTTGDTSLKAGLQRVAGAYVEILAAMAQKDRTSEMATEGSSGKGYRIKRQGCLALLRFCALAWTIAWVYRFQGPKGSDGAGSTWSSTGADRDQQVRDPGHPEGVLQEGCRGGNTARSKGAQSEEKTRTKAPEARICATEEDGAVERFSRVNSRKTLRSWRKPSPTPRQTWSVL